MATIGLSIESEAMNAVLFDPEVDAVVASQATSLAGGESTSLNTAVQAMKAVAARRNIGVDAIGLVYRSSDERDRFKAAIDETGVLGGVQLVAASTAFLGWLARTREFEDAECVLLYYIDPAGVSLSLADSATASLSTPKTALLDSMSPERIGSTVPLAWEVLDEAGRKPDSVALFGDLAGNQGLIDILALGIGVPVVEVSDSDQIAARGASLAVVGDSDLLFPPAIVDDSVDAVPGAPVAEVRPTEALAPTVSSLVPVVPFFESVPSAVRSRRPIPRKKLVLTAALLVGILSGGVALASTLPRNDPASSEANIVEETDETGFGTSLLGTTQSVEITQSAPPAEPAPPVVLDPVTLAPVVVPTLDPQWTIDPTPESAFPDEALTPIPAYAIPPAAAVVPPKTVEPPVFAVPTIVPEPGKSQEQLEQEAWDRHWERTAEWLQQEFVGP